MAALAHRRLARVAATERLSSDVRLLSLDFGADAPAFEPGGHLDFELPLGGTNAIRSYSMVGSPGPGLVDIAVKLSPESRGGSAYMSALRVGDRVAAFAKRNNLPVTFAGGRYAILAGGIGVTPMLGIARALVAAGKDVRFVYCVRDETDAPFVAELSAEFGGRIEVHSDRRAGPYDLAGLIDGLDRGAYLYMCGPVPMMDAANHLWRARGRPVDRLRFETFGNSGGYPTAEFNVRVVETGSTVRIGARETLLDALISAGQPVMYDCRKGECGLCKVRVVALDGVIDHRDVFLGEAEKAAQTEMCCCVSRIYGRSASIQVDAIMHGRTGHAPA